MTSPLLRTFNFSIKAEKISQQKKQEFNVSHTYASGKQGYKLHL